MKSRVGSDVTEKRANATLRIRIAVYSAVLCFTFICGSLVGWAFAHSHYSLNTAHSTGDKSHTDLASPPLVALTTDTLSLRSSAGKAASLPIDTTVAAATSASADSRAIHSLCHKRITERKYVASYLNELGLSGEGVEIGVRDGSFSVWTLQNWKGAKLHLVDPWAAQDTTLYKDFSNVEQKQQDERYGLVKGAMERDFAGRFEIHRDYSLQAAAKFADESLDYIYIDARHDYKGVAEDLAAWYPKLRKGGLCAGHDFVPDGDHKEGAFGVQRAVKEFLDKIGKEPLSISNKDANGGRSEPQTVDGGWTTFYFLK